MTTIIILLSLLLAFGVLIIWSACMAAKRGDEFVPAPHARKTKPNP